MSDIYPSCHSREGGNPKPAVDPCLRRDDTERRRQRDNRVIPLYFVAFFVVLAVLDGIFVYLATSTHTGVVSENAYEEGLAYNRTIAAAEAQERQGWDTSLAMEGGRLRFMLKDRHGQPVKAAAVTAHFIRPTQGGHDFKSPLKETDPGIYEAAVDAPLKGQWDARIHAEWNEHHYQIQRRVMLP